MAFCSYYKGITGINFTSIENAFFKDYMPDAPAVAVKVYLYGLYVCQNVSNDFSAEDLANTLNLDLEKVEECFYYWQEFDLVSIISSSPLTVKYLEIPKFNKPRKYKAEKYSDFSATLQAVLPSRMITPAEYAEYYDLMETFNIKPDALLMIINYCADKKGSDISYKYISKVTKSFAEKGITDMASIEKELSEYTQKSSEVSAILSTLGLKRSPEVRDSELLQEWTNLGYSIQTILHICEISSKKDMNYLNGFIRNLYENNLLSSKEIDAYLEQRRSLISLAKQVCNSLGHKYQVVDTFISTYLSDWMQKGYDGNTLQYIATFLYKHGYNSPEKMDDFINQLYEEGHVTQNQVAFYFETLGKNEKFIKQILNTLGIVRKPTTRDLKQLQTWYDWGFDNDVIEYSASISTDKNNPFTYMNAVLSSWKQQGLFALQQVKTSAPPVNFNKNGMRFENERQYTKEELDKILINVDDFKF